MRSAKHLLSINNMRSLYFSLVHSHLSYGTVIWGTSCQYRLQKLEKIQKKCIRNVCKLSYNDSTSMYFKQHNILKLTNVFNVQLGRLMYFYFNGQLPDSLQDLLFLMPMFMNIILVIVMILMSQSI